tara:strand:+ start:3039 stop:3212 length:174 start_codon:yes stop_codon:yes gene_type:complete
MRLYPKNKFSTFGEFVRTIGGWRKYYLWAMDNKDINRNDLCFCNSNKKYKKCCGRNG